MNVPKLRFSEFSENYKKIKLKNMTKLITKGTTPRKYTDSGVNFIKVENLLDNQIKNINSYISYETHNNELKRSILKEYDILFSIAGALGRTAIVTKEELPANTNQACSIIRLDNLNDYNLYYLMERLHHFDIKSYINKCQSVGAQPNLSLEQVGNICINIPNKKEQDRVGRLIELVNKKIELQTKKIDALKLFKLCIFKHIFGTATVKIKLKNVSNITKGEQINSEELSKSGSYYMLNGGTEPSGYLEKYNTLENTITISEGGNSCGYVKYNKYKFWCGGHCYSIKNKLIDNHYLYQLLKFNEKKIMRLRIGSGLPNIQKKDLENFELFIHEKNNQYKIANLLMKYDTKIELEKNKLDKFTSLKTGLLQNMFI